LLQISELCVQFLEQNQFIRQSCRRPMSGLSGQFKNVGFSNWPLWVKRVGRNSEAYCAADNPTDRGMFSTKMADYAYAHPPYELRPA
jgi:hypothetical protein